jgi:hypothetical protein
MADVFTLDSIARVGLPEGQYVVKVEDIEGGMSGATPPKPKIQFTATVAHSENPTIKPGYKEVWSYTWGAEYRSILGNDLMKAKIPPSTQLSADHNETAKALSAIMRGNFYVIAVSKQKRSTTGQTNTNIIGPYQPPGSNGASVPPSAAALPAATAPPASTMVAPPPAAAAPAAGNGALAGLFAAAQPAPAAEAPPAAAPVDDNLTPALITAINAGQRPPLGEKQISQLEMIGLVAIAAEYKQLAALAAMTGGAAPATAGFGSV